MLPTCSPHLSDTQVSFRPANPVQCPGSALVFQDWAAGMLRKRAEVELALGQPGAATITSYWGFELALDSARYHASNYLGFPQAFLYEHRVLDYYEWLGDLHWYQGLTHEAIGQIVGVSTRTVKRRWQAARLELSKSVDFV